MKVIVQILSAGVALSLASCSTESDRALPDAWVTAPSLDQPSVPYTPNPIVTAREADAGTWIWDPPRAAPKTMEFAQLLREVAAARSLRPRPLILFTFAQNAERSELVETRSQIAAAAGCSIADPCVEGTPDQLP